MISCGNEHTLVLTECGKLIQHGSDFNGQLRTDITGKINKIPIHIACGEESSAIV